jgi:hypothetical protein
VPPAGFVEVRTLPSGSVATHSDTDGQEMALGASPKGSAAAVQVPGPPAGSVEVSTWLSVSARHRLADGQTTLVNACQ